ncbi:MAG: HAD-IB family hydrolase [bacterium]
MNAIAFFDVDDTLLKGSSGVMLAKLLFLHKGERVELPYALELLKAYLQYKYVSIEYDILIEQGLEKFAGRSRAEVEAICQECFDRYMVRAVYRGGYREIRKHKAMGNRVVLLTASLQPLMSLLGEYLRVDDVIATKLVFEEGITLNKAEKPYCYEDGKRVLAQEYADRFDVPLEACYFYTDSISDLPLLEEVGRPVATNPDRVLFLTALARNWRIKWFNRVLPPNFHP